MAQNDILFTCVGTSDPVRGYRDGGLLHIMRHYRPGKVYIFLSSEMEKHEAEDHRFSKTLQYARDHWADYDPQENWYRSHIENAADLDAVYEPLMDFFKQATQDNPDAQILINLSSGTPQMKIVLAQLTLNTQYRVRGIQVLNPEHASGSSERTNAKSYAIDEELELNEDNEADAPNRCTEPKMLSLQRSEQLKRVHALLDLRDYRALVSLRTILPENLQKLVQHLAARNDMQMEEAKKFARGLTLPFKLYPARSSTNDSYRELSEYFLLLRNLQLTGRYSEFVLRLNPFLTTLACRLLELRIPDEFPVFITGTPSRRRFDPDKLASVLPAEKQALDNRLYRPAEAGDVSLHVLVQLLHVLGLPSESTLDLLDACLNLNQKQRNQTAHQLCATTAQDIINACVDSKGHHYNAAELIQRFCGLMKAAYSEYWDNDLLTIYDRCADYIKKNL